MPHSHPISRDPSIQRQSWDRGDGYDARDPNAPDVPTCAGCDALIFDEACADCTVPQFTVLIPVSGHGFVVVDREAA